MDDQVHPLDAEHRRALTEALLALEGTEFEEQVNVFPAGGEPAWTLDVVHFDAGPDGRFAVYAEFEPGRPLIERGVPWPAGTEVEAEEDATATVTFGPLSADEAAEVVTGWAATLFGDRPVEWSTTLTA